MPLVAGIDSSTQATKIEVRDADTGELVATGRAPHPRTTPPRSEQDPAAWEMALAAAWAASGQPPVKAVAVAGQQHGMVALDEAFRPVRPAKLWNDTESADDATWLLDQLGGGETGARAWAERVGSVPLAAFTITKLSWLHRTEPEHWARLARVCLPHDYLTYRLTGRFVTDRGDASGTGYWSPAEGRYRRDVLDLVDNQRDWSGALPEVLGPSEAAGDATSVFAGSPVVAAGTGDNMAAALALALGPGDSVLSFGTSGTAYAVSKVPTHDASGAVAGFADATGRFLPLACTLNAAGVLDVMARLLGVDLEGLDRLAMEGDPLAGVVLVPYFDGERTPNRPDATGLLTGLRSSTTPADVARAAVDGVVCGLLDARDQLGQLVPVDGRTFVIGGGARSSALGQSVADLADAEAVVPDATELVAAGACVQAASVLRGLAPEEVATQWHLSSGHTVEPRQGVARGAVRRAYAMASDR